MIKIYNCIFIFSFLLLMMLYYVVVTYNIFFNYNMSHVIDEWQ